MSKRDHRLLLEDIIEAVDKVFSYTDGIEFSEFEGDSKTIDAVIRNFEIIGEAAHQLPGALQDKYAEVEWNRIIGLRNRIVHEYFGVDLHIIWNIISNNLGEMKKQIEVVLEKES